MIQPLPLNNVPVPIPGAPIDPKTADLFAAILAGQGSLPQSGLPEFVPAVSEPEAEPDAEAKTKALSVPNVSWADMKFFEVLPADLDQPSVAVGPEVKDLTAGAHLEGFNDRVPVSVHDLNAVPDIAQPGMRRLEVMVDPEALAPRTPVSLGATFRLKDFSSQKPSTHAAEAPEIRNLPVVDRSMPQTPAARIIVGRSDVPSPSERDSIGRPADENRPRRSMSRSESEPSAPSAKAERGRPHRNQSQPDSSSRQDQKREAGMGSRTRPLGITREFEPPAHLEQKFATPEPTAHIETLPIQKDTVVPTPTVIHEAIAAPSVTDRPVLLEAPHEGTTVRFVLEDWSANTPVRSIRIALEPGELGTLNIALQHRNGQVHARVVVDNAQTLQLVQTQAATLQRSLAEQGMNFGTFSVTLASNAAWTGLSGGGSQRATSGDPERKSDISPRRTRRNEVKTT